MLVIDLDSHSRPRREDYVIPAEYEHLRPRAFTDSRGNIRRIFDNKIVSVLTAGEREVSNREGKSAWHAAEYDADVRYEQVKEAGIDYQFVSAGTVGMFSYIDADPGSAFIRASNNFIYDNFMKRYPKTFTGAPQLPLQDTRAAMKELERCVKDLGMHTFMMPTNWNGIDLADPHWWNLYDRARDLGVRGVIVHIGSFAGPFVGKERVAILGSDGTAGRRILSQPFEYCTNIVNHEIKAVEIFIDGAGQHVLQISDLIDVLRNAVLQVDGELRASLQKGEVELGERVEHPAEDEVDD